MKDHPRLLETVYVFTERLLKAAWPLLKRVSPRASAKLLLWIEKPVKEILFNCQMCGQCILHSTGMTCPMNCPKNLRNGPCGGVRANGHCEVIPEMPCVWVLAWRRDAAMATFGGEIQLLQPPVNRTLQHTSSWVNMLQGSDSRTPPGWTRIELEEGR
ncbi:MAG: hypothetical protein DWI57_15395 [Chloroflexi bacterium]|nr:MAG: hypothetical protein DWI57_15395 [Chloroflexota bacterium]